MLQRSSSDMKHWHTEMANRPSFFKYQKKNQHNSVGHEGIFDHFACKWTSRTGQGMCCSSLPVSRGCCLLAPAKLLRGLCSAMTCSSWNTELPRRREVIFLTKCSIEYFEIFSCFGSDIQQRRKYTSHFGRKEGGQSMCAQQWQAKEPGFIAQGTWPRASGFCSRNPRREQ